MKEFLSKVVIFAVGAIIGSAATCQYFKKKYQKIADEEIESVKQIYRKEPPVVEESLEEPEVIEEKPVDISIRRQEATSYRDLLKQCGYADAAIFEMEDERNEREVSDMYTLPYVISPDELGDSDYPCVTLVYYSDGVLANTYDDIIRDVDAIVGLESLSHFGENIGDEDTVYVRNEELKTDFEILRDLSTFEEAVGNA